MKNKIVIYLVFLLAFLGLLDSAYLTFEHFQNTLPPCSLHFQLVDCGAVLRSKYSVVFGIPLAAFGILDYLAIITWSVLLTLKPHKIFPKLLALQAALGFLFSVYFMYLQLGVLHALCFYCTISALLSTLIFTLAIIFLRTIHNSPTQ